jgi:hypothetical protein
MVVDAYLILEPGADRAYFCHNFPLEWFASRPVGSRVFSFRLDVPGFEKVEGVIQLTPTDVVQLAERTMVQDVVETREFTCPKCGSHAFGSAEVNGRYERMCHGFGCRFAFPDTEDHLYFKGTGHFMPVTMTVTTGAT